MAKEKRTLFLELRLRTKHKHGHQHTKSDHIFLTKGRIAAGRIVFHVGQFYVTPTSRLSCRY